MNFTNDEMNLMCIYDTSDRTGTLKALRDMRKELAEEETELRAMTDSAISKLEAMTDEEYSKMELYPDFDEDETDM